MGHRNSSSSRSTTDAVATPVNGRATPLNTPGINYVLSRLPRADRDRILEHCQRKFLKIEEVLYEAGAAISFVYFPLSGMVSMVIGSEEGGTIEVGVVGNEGLLGTPAALGSRTSHVRALVQTQGEFLRMGVQDFQLELKRSEALTDLVHRYSQALMIQISQSVMCNRLHSMEERICRWLLMAHDRAGTDTIVLTQAFIAEMLGIRRPSVTVAAGMLQKAGFIDYFRGNVTVLNRAGLEDTACECYAIVARELAELMGGVRPAGGGGTLSNGNAPLCQGLLPLFGQCHASRLDFHQSHRNQAALVKRRDLLGVVLLERSKPEQILLVRMKAVPGVKTSHIFARHGSV